jgi:surface antigen
MKQIISFIALFTAVFLVLQQDAVIAESNQQKTIDKPIVQLTDNFESERIIKLNDIFTPEHKQEMEENNNEPIIHTVASGESLSSIATKHQTTWQRLWSKNGMITNPDLLHVGTSLEIPTPDEELQDRELPRPEPIAQSSVNRQQADTSSRNSLSVDNSKTVPITRGSSDGNRYVPGYCTWYAKNRRPDLPNNLGNADTWVSRAAAQGIPTGNTPKVGAIGQQGMHVVYIEAVNSDGTVTISEMNWKGLYIVSSRTISATNFRYIY